ncbi:MAG: bifunctional adenosylcobinamide kinase/adenosylcobinamide-phosphate guanylyltransferase [Clostridia bacterium]|jgi:adenosylcobinamide kinase/adenosylcobinamide-phosphate guanylyltransferase
MGKMVLVTGGARSGKSRYAEEIAMQAGGNVVFVATSVSTDEEMEYRIKMHKMNRPQYWETVEGYKDFDILLEECIGCKDAVLVDCITMMVSNIMFEKCKDLEHISVSEADEIEEYVKSEISKLLKTAKSSDVKFIIVTNEVGMGVVPQTDSGRVFRDIAGRANQMIANTADEVYLCVSGIPVKIK